MPFDRDEVEIGYGKKLEYSDNGTSGWTQVFGTIDIQLPQRELGEAEITNDDSEDFHRDFIPGLYDPGVAPFTYVYTDSVFAGLETLFQLASVRATRAAATKYWRTTLADGSTKVYRGFLKKHDLPVDVDGVPTCEAEIRVSGKMTTASGS